METISEHAVLDLLSAIPDPELGIGIVDLGLIYGVEITGQKVRVEMTMTTPACPLHAHLRQSIQDAIQARLPEVESVDVVLVWDPPWHPMLMSLGARRKLGWRV
jgi:metal-sulfur cluster biosynthetic enzyme